MLSTIEFFKTKFEITDFKPYGTRQEIMYRDILIYTLRKVLLVPSAKIEAEMGIPYKRQCDFVNKVTDKVSYDPDYRKQVVDILAELDLKFPHKSRFGDHILPPYIKTQRLINKTKVIREVCDKQRELLESLYN